MTILLVEDNFGDQTLFRLALENSEDIHLEVVGDGCEALHFLRREGKYTQAPEPNLVVLDINLPKMSGTEVLAEMKRNPGLKHLPVVMFTSAKATGAILYSCRQASLYISKPDGMDNYFAVVKALTEYCRNIQRFPDLRKAAAENLRSLLALSQHSEVNVLDTAQ